MRLVRSARLLALAAALGAGWLATGCVVAPVGPYYSGEVVSAPPPAPQQEYYGAPPAVGYVWIGGFWNWHAGRHAWVGGHWEAPRPGHYWVPHSWGRQGNGWVQRPGYWSRR